MNTSPAPDKRELRDQIRGVLRALPEEIRQAESLRAESLLRQQEIWKQARAILFYSPIPGEVDLSMLMDEALASGKIVALPRFVNEQGIYEASRLEKHSDLALGQFDIREPAAHCATISLKQLDLVLVPGIAFDLSGHRLGRGQGFYDRLLSQSNGSRCGVGFDLQVVERVPREAHDVLMNFILTPSRWLTLPSPAL